MPEINLLNSDPHVTHSDYGALSRLVSRLLKFLLLLAIIAFVAVFILNWFNQKDLTAVKAKIQTAKAEALANQDRNELVTRQEQLAELETLVDNHVYWSYLLPELARVTLKSAKYSGIEASSDGSLTLVVNLPNYEEIEKYMQIFDLPEFNQQFSNVRIMSINTVETESTIETQLRIQLTFNPAYIKGRM